MMEFFKDEDEDKRRAGQTVEALQKTVRHVEGEEVVTAGRVQYPQSALLLFTGEKERVRFAAAVAFGKTLGCLKTLKLGTTSLQTEACYILLLRQGKGSDMFKARGDRCRLVWVTAAYLNDRSQNQPFNETFSAAPCAPSKLQ